VQHERENAGVSQMHVTQNNLEEHLFENRSLWNKWTLFRVLLKINVWFVFV